MKIPVIFYGTPKQVKKECDKIVSSLKKGATFCEILEIGECVDVNDYPNALIWIDDSRLKPKNEQHFFLFQIGSSIVDFSKMTQKDIMQIKEKNAEYLSTTPWGTLILNWPFLLFWGMQTPQINGYFRKGFTAILEGTVKYWDQYMGLGKRFCDGGNSLVYFNQLLPAYGNAMALIGVDPRKKNKSGIINILDGWDNPQKCRNLLHRVRYDDEFWDQVVTGELAIR